MTTMGPAPTPGQNYLVNTGEKTPFTEGAGIFHDATETVKGFSSGNWAEGLINAGATVAGVAGVLVDPLAALFSAGFGWLVEHVWFLKEPLDWLIGDQEALDGMAKTWESVSDHLKDTSDDLRNWVNNDTTGWSGKDSDQYRGFGVDRADTYAGVATAAGGIASLVRTCKIVLKVVRDIVRDIISDAIGKLISICLRWAPAVAAAGAGLAGAIAECVPVAVKWANKALEACRRLTKAFSNAGGLFKKLDDILVNAKTSLSKSGDDFVNVLKKGIDADIRRSMTDFSVTDMAKDAYGEAKKVAVDGVKTAPAEFLPKLGIEATKEATKFRDWEDEAKDGGGWRTWRDLRAEEEKKQEENRKEARGG
ncbi:WXG100 family type VII secretion target [Lentzea sp. JNUCC 0626]|uniref:WXG100 family type VII secretion target n=1 Tax=Lentzea sp. JNUCC 0626 TaxID=3367513 RepID=UPI0037493CD3